MNTYTIIVYVLPGRRPSCRHRGCRGYVTDAMVRLRVQLLLESSQCELVGVIAGRVHFELVDCSQVALAPYCAAVSD